MKMFKGNKKGFTLIELIVVIAILAILAAIAIPAFNGISDQAKVQVDRANASNIATAYNTYNALHPAAQLGNTFATAAALQTAITTGDATVTLWPKGLASADAEAAWKYISIAGGVATVTASAAAVPTT